jgi:hexosaminidase
MLQQPAARPSRRASTPIVVAVAVLALVLAALIGPLAPAHPAHAAGRPNTIPALREWTHGSGSYTFGAASRIVHNGAALADEAAVLADDLLRATGLTIAAVAGSGPGPGDIYLTLGAADTAIGNEGYLLAITDRVTSSARADAGAFWGTRTVLQLLGQGSTIAAGSARDWPMYGVRGMHADTGRKYLTPAWLRDHIRELAYLKINSFHLHLSDREGFRIQSTSHPEVPTAPSLTKAEVAALISVAARYHVTIVPELDMPGHMTAALRNHPELWQGGTNASQLDVGIDPAYTFIRDLLNEYLPLFPGPYWHIGADEYNLGTQPHYVTYAQQHFCPPGTTANATDALVGFVNFANGIVQAAGKRSIAWYDILDRATPGCTSLDTDVVVDYWNGDPTARALPRGDTVINSNRWQTYYVLGGAKTRLATVLAWDPAVFAGATIPDAHPQNLGGKGLHIWCDKPNNQTEAQIATHVYEVLRGAGQKTWNSPMLPTGFSTIINLVGRSPGYGEHLGG